MLFCMMVGPEAGVSAVWFTGTVAVVAGHYGRRSEGVGTLWPGHFAMVMLGTPTRGTSLTVIWNKRYSIWKASRFQRASGPLVLTE
jgi:hypothetical protein